MNLPISIDADRENSAQCKEALSDLERIYMMPEDKQINTHTHTQTHMRIRKVA